MSEVMDVLPAIQASNELRREAVQAARQAGEDFPTNHTEIVEYLRARRRACLSVVTLPGREVRLKCDLCRRKAVIPWEERATAEDRVHTHVRTCPWTKPIAETQ